MDEISNSGASINSNFFNKIDDDDIEIVQSELCIDDVQVWYLSDMVTREWLYNNGQGRINAIHPIYGEENGYRPKKVSALYYCVP